MMKGKLQLNAVLLRNILMATIALLIIGGIGSFLFFDKQLTSYASTVAGDKAKASNSSQEISQLQQLQKEMEDNRVAVTRAANIVGDSKYYQYQDKIIDDLTSYAKAAGLEVQSFTFSEGATTSGSTAASSTGGAAKAPVGLKISYATVTLSGKNLSYKAIMTFLKSIEQNLTKMEVTGISFIVNRTDGKISTQPITIGVYTR